MKFLPLLFLLSLAFAQLPRTQEEAQAKFDAAVIAADGAVAEVVSYDRDSGKEVLLPVWKATSEEEIRSLSRSFRLLIPPPKRGSLDGQDVLLFEGFHCGCRGHFVVTLKKSQKVLLTFAVAHGEHIESKELLEHSAIKIDKAQLATFYNQLIEAAKKTANKTVDPTTTAVTAPAGQEPRHQ